MVDRITHRGEGVRAAAGGEPAAHRARQSRREATSSPRRARAARERRIRPSRHELLAEPTHTFEDYTDTSGRRMLAVGSTVPGLPWVVVVEQPTEEAFRVATGLRLQLLVAIGLALLGTVVVGSLWGRSFITPHLRAHARHPGASPKGGWTSASWSAGRDEIRQLGDAFNSMADRLVELQEDVRKQERQAMFGRIAAGLVHDLSHPIQNIYNSCKLIQQDVRRSRVPRHLQAYRRARNGGRQARARGPAQHRPADPARALPDRSRQVGRRGGRLDAAARGNRGHRRCARSRRRAAPTSRATCSRSAASTAT